MTNLLANNIGYITRTLDGVEFRFEGERTFNGWIELFIDTKESGDTRGATDAMYSLKADGTVSVTNYGGSFTTEGIVWTVNASDGGGTRQDFSSPTRRSTSARSSPSASPSGRATAKAFGTAGAGTI